MYKDITLLIPTHNRHKYLNRILNYYIDTPIKIVVCDSTKEAYINNDRSPHVTYQHYPDFDFGEKCRRSLASISSKYTVTCADDDFIVPAAINKCVEFLEENTDYASVQGLSIVFENKKKIISFPYSLAAVGLDINNEKPSERVKQLLVPYVAPLYYIVQRTKNLQDTFIALPREIDIATSVLIELFVGVVSITYGKHKVLPIFYSARELIPHKPRTNDLKTITDTNLYKKTYRSFIDILTNLLSEKENISKENANEHIIEALNAYIQSYNKDSIVNKRIASPAKSLGMKKIIDNIPYINSIKQFYSNTVLKIISLQQMQKLHNTSKLTMGIKGYPYYDEDAKKDWEIIKSYIKKHGTTKHLYQPS